MKLLELIIDILEGFFSFKITENLTLYGLLGMFFKYIFVIIIYYFIFNIIKMIYLDIRGINNMNYVADTYLKLINRKEKLPFKTQEHYFIGNNTTIGRTEQNDIVLKDRFISKRHARITKEDGIYFIQDLNSANGTYINGQQITNAVELRDKDIIDVGQVEFLFVNGENDE